MENMEKNENLAAEEAVSTEDVDENTEGTAEEPVKLYTEDEFNARVNEVSSKRVARNAAKIYKENARKYEPLVNVLKAGTGKNSVEEITEYLEEYYKSKGMNLPEKSQYSAKDNEILARADAEEIISFGDDEVVEEADRLAKLGVSNMTEREKSIFKILAEHQRNTERRNELAKLGVTKDFCNSKEFRDFEALFVSDTPISKIYDLYSKTLPQKEIKTMGSLKNTTSEDTSVKDYYSYEDAIKFSKKDLQNNPKLMKAIENSMAKW